MISQTNEPVAESKAKRAIDDIIISLSTQTLKAHWSTFLSGQNHHTQPVSVSIRVQDVHAWQEGAVAMGSAPAEGQLLSVLRRCEMWQLTSMERRSLRCRPPRGGVKLQVVQKDAAPQALLETVEWHGTPPVTSPTLCGEPNYMRPRNCYHANWFNRRRARGPLRPQHSWCQPKATGKELVPKCSQHACLGHWDDMKSLLSALSLCTWHRLHTRSRLPSLCAK